MFVILTFLKINSKLQLTWRFETRKYFTCKNAKYGHRASNLTPNPMICGFINLNYILEETTNTSFYFFQQDKVIQLVTLLTKLPLYSLTFFSVSYNAL